MKLWWLIIGSFLVLLCFGFLLINTRDSRVSLPTNQAQIEEANTPPTPTIGNQGNPVDPKQHLTMEEFKVLLQDVNKSFLTKEDLKNTNPEDLARSPILSAAEQLEKISQAVHNEPALGEEALQFYFQCANEGTYPDIVRALCFSSYKILSKKLSKDLGKVSSSIRNLSEKIQGF